MKPYEYCAILVIAFAGLSCYRPDCAILMVEVSTTEGSGYESATLVTSDSAAAGPLEVTQNEPGDDTVILVWDTLDQRSRQSRTLIIESEDGLQAVFPLPKNRQITSEMSAWQSPSYFTEEQYAQFRIMDEIEPKKTPREVDVQVRYRFEHYDCIH